MASYHTSIWWRLLRFIISICHLMCKFLNQSWPESNNELHEHLTILRTRTCQVQGPKEPGITRVIHSRTRVGTETRVLKKVGFKSIPTFKNCFWYKNILYQLYFAGASLGSEQDGCQDRKNVNQVTHFFVIFSKSSNF